MSKQGRMIIAGLGVGGAVILLWLTSAAGGSAGAISEGEIEAYPNQPVTIVSWASPGGPTDLLARTIASVGAQYFGQRINVVTREGGGGAVGMSYLAGQRPDGYTLGITTSSGIISMAAGHIPFSVDDFSGIIGIQNDPFVISVRANSPFQDLEDFFSHAAENPGVLTVSGFGTASAHYLAFARLTAAAGGPQIRWIAYEGSGDANVAALGGHTDAANTNFSVVREHVRAGTMRLLGISTEIPAMRESVRTYAEQGFDVEPMHWRGVQGPPDMPPELITKVRDLLLQTIRDPEFQRFMESTGNEYHTMTEPAAFQEWMRQEQVESRQLLEELGLVGEL